MKTFPILCSSRTNKGCPHHCPRSLPFDLVEPHRAQAMKNHSQTLERLAERGGLSIAELFAVLHDRDWFDLFGWATKRKPDAPTDTDCLAFIHSLGSWQAIADDPHPEDEKGGRFWRVRWTIPNERGEYLYVRHYGGNGSGWNQNAAEGDAKRMNEEGRRPTAAMM